jgi:hypothetical protein
MNALAANSAAEKTALEAAADGVTAGPLVRDD